MSIDKTSQSQSSIYHPLKTNRWIGINWSKTEKTIKQLQYRIAKAAEQGEYRKVRNLQRLLKRSLSARLKAVQLVTQENSTKNLSGIDGTIWSTDHLKLKAAFELRQKTSRHNPPVSAYRLR